MITYCPKLKGLIAHSAFLDQDWSKDTTILHLSKPSRSKIIFWFMNQKEKMVWKSIKEKKQGVSSANVEWANKKSVYLPPTACAFPGDGPALVEKNIRTSLQCYQIWGACAVSLCEDSINNCWAYIKQHNGNPRCGILSRCFSFLYRKPSGCKECTGSWIKIMKRNVSINKVWKSHSQSF